MLPPPWITWRIELILREPDRDAVERRAALAAVLAERVAVVALLRLENERALPLERRRRLSMCAGTGSPLQASITGLHGA